jgi:glycosyltransferase involved in cell wall biosynthesis
MRNSFKVLLWVRSDCFRAKGGDMIQVENTFIELKKLGLDVVISDKNNVDLTDFDIVHLFQLDWTPETYLHAKKAHKLGKKIILSPIHHSVSEVKKFDDEYVFGLRRLSKYLFVDQFQRDTFKNIYRSILDRSKALPTLYSVFLGLKNMNRKVISWSDYVLTQTKIEAEDLSNTYGVNFKWEIVPNGVGELFLEKKKYQNLFNFDNYILCVGRIEPRKNNLAIISAVKLLRKELNKDIKLVFVGKTSSKHFEYTKFFLEELKENKWVHYNNYLAYEQIPSIYKYAKVCVSASWFETTGLTLLEALFMGANAVSTSPRAREILGEFCSYCEPNDIESIKEAIKTEYFKPKPKLPSDFKNEYTWENTAKKTLKIYNDVMKEYQK